MIYSESGRLFYKHSSGRGIVMCYEQYGIPKRVFVFSSDFQKYMKLPIADIFITRIDFPPKSLTDYGIDDIFHKEIEAIELKSDNIDSYFDSISFDGYKPIIPPIDILFRIVADNKIITYLENKSENDYIGTKSFISNEIDYASSTYLSFNQVWCLNRNTLYIENIEDDKLLVRPIILL